MRSSRDRLRSCADSARSELTAFARDDRGIGEGIAGAIIDALLGAIGDIIEAIVTTVLELLFAPIVDIVGDKLESLIVAFVGIPIPGDSLLVFSVPDSSRAWSNVYEANDNFSILAYVLLGLGVALAAFLGSFRAIPAKTKRTVYRRSVVGFMFIIFNKPIAMLWYKFANGFTRLLLPEESCWTGYLIGSLVVGAGAHFYLGPFGVITLGIVAVLAISFLLVEIARMFLVYALFIFLPLFITGWAVALGPLSDIGESGKNGLHLVTTVAFANVPAAMVWRAGCIILGPPCWTSTREKGSCSGEDIKTEPDSLSASGTDLAGGGTELTDAAINGVASLFGVAGFGDGVTAVVLQSDPLSFGTLSYIVQAALLGPIFLILGLAVVLKWSFVGKSFVEGLEEVGEAAIAGASGGAAAAGMSMAGANYRTATSAVQDLNTSTAKKIGHDDPAKFAEENKGGDAISARMYAKGSELEDGGGVISSSVGRAMKGMSDKSPVVTSGSDLATGDQEWRGGQLVNTDVSTAGQGPEASTGFANTGINNAVRNSMSGDINGVSTGVALTSSAESSVGASAPTKITASEIDATNRDELAESYGDVGEQIAQEMKNNYGPDMSNEFNMDDVRDSLPFEGDLDPSAMENPDAFGREVQNELRDRLDENMTLEQNAEQSSQFMRDVLMAYDKNKK